MRRLDNWKLFPIADEVCPAALLERLPLVSLVGGMADEAMKLKVLNHLLKSESQAASAVAAIRRWKGDLVREACWRGQSRLLATLLNGLKVTADEVGTGGPSLIWIACATGNLSALTALLTLPGGPATDEPHVDGTTAFAVALGNCSFSMIEILISADCIAEASKEKMYSLANEYLRAFGGKKTPFMDFLFHTLMRQDRLDFKKRLPLRSVPSNLKLLKLKQNYPMMNEKTEATYNECTKMDAAMRRLSGDSYVTVKQLTRFVVGDFCLRSPGGTWTVPGDVHVNACVHDDDQISRHTKSRFTNMLS